MGGETLGAIHPPYMGVREPSTYDCLWGYSAAREGILLAPQSDLGSRGTKPTALAVSSSSNNFKRLTTLLMAFQPGNKLGGRKEKPFRDALNMELKEAGEDRPKLRAIAQSLLAQASQGNIAAIKEVADRLDGKVPQAIVGDIDESPIEVKLTDRELGRRIMTKLRKAMEK